MCFPKPEYCMCETDTCCLQERDILFLCLITRAYKNVQEQGNDETFYFFIHLLSKSLINIYIYIYYYT